MTPTDTWLTGSFALAEATIATVTVSSLFLWHAKGGFVGYGIFNVDFLIKLQPVDKSFRAQAKCLQRYVASSYSTIDRCR